MERCGGRIETSDLGHGRDARGTIQDVRILGIDPGLKITGYGVIDCVSARPALVAGGVIRLDARSSIAERLAKLEEGLQELFDEFKPDMCAVEKLYAHYKHPPTAILMGHARGIILLAAQKRGVRIEQYAANSIKQSLTGHGRGYRLHEPCGDCLVPVQDVVGVDPQGLRRDLSGDVRVAVAVAANP